MPPLPLTIEQAASQFRAKQTYLDSPAIGLPPRCVTEALHAIVDRWSEGEIRAPDFDAFVSSARASFARLIGVPISGVAVDSTVSSLVGLVAASLPVGAEVVCAEGDFTSLLFPFLVRQNAGELRVRAYPLERLSDSIDERTALVAVSAVQSSDGRLLDMEPLLQACKRFGARTLIDATQAVGWLPFDGVRHDYVVASAYKWLLSPRGTAFMSVRPELIPSLRPLSAGWYAGEDVWSSIYGAPLRLAANARCFDVSPAWFMWVGCAEAMQFIERVGVPAIHAHDVQLSTAFLERLELPPSGSAVVSIRGPGVLEALQAAGIVASRRDGAARIGFHLYNTMDHALAAAEVIRAAGFVPRGQRAEARQSASSLAFDVFLERGWSEHGDRPREVARELQASLDLIGDLDRISAYGGLVVHVFGEHLGEWRAGVELLARLRALPYFESGTEADAALRRGAAALELAATANTTELSAWAPSERVRTLSIAASALAAQAALDRASAYFREALALCGELPSDDPAHRALAVTSNNLAVTLEEKPVRTAEEVELMLLAARTARAEWELAGTWLNVKRAEYRLARSALVAGRPEVALQHAQSCLALCTANGAPAVELFGAHEVLALVERARGNVAGLAAAIAQARRCVACVEEVDRTECEERLASLVANR